MEILLLCYSVLLLLLHECQIQNVKTEAIKDQPEMQQTENCDACNCQKCDDILAAAFVVSGKYTSLLCGKQ